MAGINQQQRTAHSKGCVDLPPQLLAENAFQLLFERSPDAILLVDGEALVDCNQAAVEMLRYSSKNELLATTLPKLSPPQQPDGLSSAEKAINMIATAVERGSHRFEWMGKRSDESEFPVEVLLTAIPVANRHILHTVCRDISRRKGAELDRLRAEEALLSQTEILTSILNNIGDAVIVADKQHRFLIFNPAAEQMFGTGATETTADGWSSTYGLYFSDQSQMHLSDHYQCKSLSDLYPFRLVRKIPKIVEKFGRNWHFQRNNR